jgi:hypothetical protein
MEASKAQWVSPSVVDVGDIEEVVQKGTGKTVVLEGDSGEPMKNVQQDGG